MLVDEQFPTSRRGVQKEEAGKLLNIEGPGIADSKISAGVKVRSGFGCDLFIRRKKMSEKVLRLH